MMVDVCEPKVFEWQSSKAPKRIVKLQRSIFVLFENCADLLFCHANRVLNST